MRIYFNPSKLIKMDLYCKAWPHPTRKKDQVGFMMDRRIFLDERKELLYLIFNKESKISRWFKKLGGITT